MMRGFQNWWENWAQRRAEKNRRFKIPCHLGVTRTGLDGTTEERAEEILATSIRHQDAVHSEGQRSAFSNRSKAADGQDE